ncbi:efflux transporter outer membrane subunit [Pseudoduganella chitinolytica]|uniref:Efflux transporter outer membrane subunit n=1 Tax=Pseudoduganella chitinolytica TaxID=34070 RepID=A0ABY8B6Y7_9BURK|nr:efflux transporter outer membrane subunit [Pseudoduganella chitinolytica]WEF31555.1 efflux transporter outer membrane subunit [Pseudoduganella chitinolytica]
MIFATSSNPRRLAPVPLACATLVLVLLAGCSVGPDFQRPVLALPDHYSRHAATAPAAAPTDAGAPFWRHFNDPQLTALVEQALAANGDLRVALARYDSATAVLREGRLSYFPVVTASAQGGHEKVSTDQSYGYPRSHDTYSAGIHVNWELDLFGRVRRTVEQRTALVAASARDVAGLQVVIAAETAATYMQLRGLQERLRLVTQNTSNQRQVVDLVGVRLSTGRGTEFDATRSRAQLAIAGAREPALQAQIAVAQHRLAVLTGRPPGALIAELDAPRPLPALPARIDPDSPATLLRRRPDIAAAEERLHAATARVGVSTADLFPRLSLGGLLGTQAFHSSALFEGSSQSNYALLGIDWSFLDVGRVRANIAASTAESAAMLAQYQQTVLLALEETENALVRYARTRSEDEMLERAARDSDQAAQLARLRYKAGEIGLYELLDAERVVLDAQDAFADSRTRSAMAAVALYKTLAGGWPERAPERVRAAPAHGAATTVAQATAEVR